MVHFMSISQLKQMLNLPVDFKIEILQDEVTGNKSFNIDGVWFRVSKTLDPTQPVVFHTDKLDTSGKPDWTQGILSNAVNTTKKVIGTVG